MAVIPLTPGQAGRGQTYPWFGTASQPNSLTMTNGSTLTVLDAAGDKVTVSPTAINLVRSTGAGGAVPVIPPAVGTTQFFIQMGSLVAATTAGGDLTVTFPVAFPTAYDSIVVSNGDATVSTQLVMGVFAATASSFKINVVVSSTGAAFGNTTVRANWMAIGH